MLCTATSDRVGRPWVVAGSANVRLAVPCDISAVAARALADAIASAIDAKIADGSAKAAAVDTTGAKVAEPAPAQPNSEPPEPDRFRGISAIVHRWVAKIAGAPDAGRVFELLRDYVLVGEQVSTHL